MSVARGVTGRRCDYTFASSLVVRLARFEIKLNLMRIRYDVADLLIQALSFIISPRWELFLILFETIARTV